MNSGLVNNSLDESVIQGASNCALADVGTANDDLPENRPNVTDDNLPDSVEVDGSGAECTDNSGLSLCSSVVSSQNVEELSCALESRGNGVMNEELSIIKDGKDIDTLKAETLTDPTLAIARGLADRQQQGYRWVEGLVLKYHRDEFVESRSPLVLPSTFCGRVMELAHEVWPRF